MTRTTTNTILCLFLLALISKTFADEISSATSKTTEDNGTLMEGRGRLKKILLPILFAVTIVTAIVLPAILKIIALIAIKGLTSGTISLIMTKLLGLKALLNQNNYQHYDHGHHHHDESAAKPSYFFYLPHKNRRTEPFLTNGPANWDQWQQDDMYGGSH